MAKKDTTDALLKQLKGFSLTGAKFKSPGNIPTGHFILDFVIHYGCDPTKIDLNAIDGYNPSKSLGLPLGKLVEFFGGEGGGKSSLAYRVCGYAQRMGYTAAWIDAEHSFSESLATINGCDPESIIYPNTNLCAEDILDLIQFLCKSQKVPMEKDGKEVFVDAPKVIVVDSIASLVPKARAEANSEQQFMGLLPRIMSDNLGKIADAAEANNVLLIFVNQLREKIGMLWGNPETSPGGHALKHFFSLRLKITKKSSKDANIYKMDDETGEEKLIGRYSYVRLEKNRFAKPFLDSLEIPIYFENYFPDIEEMIFDAGRQVKVISVRKGIFSWGEIKIEGRKNFINHLKDKNLISDLIKEIKLKADESAVVLPPELIKYNPDDVKEKKDKDDISRKVSRGRPKEDSGSGKEQS